jgi:hypothetical protein
LCGGCYRAYTNILHRPHPSSSNPPHFTFFLILLYHGQIHIYIKSRYFENCSVSVFRENKWLKLRSRLEWDDLNIGNCGRAFLLPRTLSNVVHLIPWPSSETAQNMATGDLDFAFPHLSFFIIIIVTLWLSMESYEHVKINARCSALSRATSTALPSAPCFVRIDLFCLLNMYTVYYILATCCTVLFNGFCRLCFRLRASLLCWFSLSFTTCFGLHGHLQVYRIFLFSYAWRIMFRCFFFLPFFHVVTLCAFPSLGWVTYEVLLFIIIYVIFGTVIPFFTCFFTCASRQTHTQGNKKNNERKQRRKNTSK